MAMESRLTFQKAIKPKGRIITEAIAKVAHKEHRGWGINNKETMNIAIDATVIIWTVFSHIAEYWSKYMKAWLYTIRGTSHFSAMSRNWCNTSFLLLEEDILMVWMKAWEQMFTCDDVILMLYTLHLKWKFHLKSAFIAQKSCHHFYLDGGFPYILYILITKIL